MRILRKIYNTVNKKIIFLLDGINNEMFTKKYVKFLKKCGVTFNGLPNYISSTVYFDGTGYKLISIGTNCVLSKDVLLLTHDFSIRTGMIANKVPFDKCKNYHVEKNIIIGNNVFIGVRTIVLPGTTIGDNVIIGAGSVVRGIIPSNSIVIGNPAKVTKKLDEWTENFEKRSIINSRIF